MLIKKKQIYITTVKLDKVSDFVSNIAQMSLTSKEDVMSKVFNSKIKSLSIYKMVGDLVDKEIFVHRRKRLALVKKDVSIDLKNGGKFSGDMYMSPEGFKIIISRLGEQSECRMVLFRNYAYLVA